MSIRNALLFVLFTYFLGLNAQSTYLYLDSEHQIPIYKGIRVLGGSPKALLGIRNVKIEFDHSKKAFCEYATEAEFFSSLRQKHGNEKSDVLIKEWKKLPNDYLEPKFIEYFNKYAEPVGLVAMPDSQYNDIVLKIEILKEEPHAHMADLRIPPYIYVICTFFDQNGDFMVQYSIAQLGSRERNDTQRLTECYAKAGKMLARHIVKKM